MMGDKFWAKLAGSIGVSLGKNASTVYCSLTECDRVAHDKHEGKYYCPRHLPKKKEAAIVSIPDRICLKEAKSAGFFKLAHNSGWGLYRVEDIDGGLGSIWRIEQDATTGDQFLVKQTDPEGEVMRRAASGGIPSSRDYKRDTKCPGCDSSDVHEDDYGELFCANKKCERHLGHKPAKTTKVAGSDDWEKFFAEWKVLPDEVRWNAERICVSQAVERVPEGGDFGSSDKWHAIYGEFSRYVGKLATAVPEWLRDNGFQQTASAWQIAWSAHVEKKAAVLAIANKIKTAGEGEQIYDACLSWMKQHLTKALAPGETRKSDEELGMEAMEKFQIDSREASLILVLAHDETGA